MPIRAFVVVLPMLTFIFAACGTPPTAEMEAARQSMANASSAGADKYASESFKEAQAAQTALDAELKAQDEKFVKSYDRSRELAAAAKTAADKAATDAAAGRERVELAAKKEKAAAARRAKLASAVKVGGQVRPPIRIKEVAPDLSGHGAVRARDWRRRDRSDRRRRRQGRRRTGREVRAVAGSGRTRRREAVGVPAFVVERCADSCRHDGHRQVHSPLGVTAGARRVTAAPATYSTCQIVVVLLTSFDTINSAFPVGLCSAGGRSDEAKAIIGASFASDTAVRHRKMWQKHLGTRFIARKVRDISLHATGPSVGSRAVSTIA